MESTKTKHLAGIEIAGMLKSKEYCRCHNRIDMVLESMGDDYYIQVRPHSFNRRTGINEGDPIKVTVQNLMRTSKKGDKTSRFNNLILLKCQKL